MCYMYVWCNPSFPPCGKPTFIMPISGVTILAGISSRLCGVMQMDSTSILPVSGWKPRDGSSVVTLHWIAQPFTRILSCLRPSSGRLRPSHTCSWACTRSTLEREPHRNNKCYLRYEHGKNHSCCHCENIFLSIPRSDSNVIYREKH